MAVILEQAATGDGYDVLCQLRNGDQRRYHFPSQPADVQAAVDALEDAYLTPLSLSQARQAATERLDAWYQAQLVTGVQAGSWRFKAGTYDQGRLAALATGVNTGLLAGVLTAESPMPSPVWDADGVPHQLTVAEFMQTTLLYIAAIGTLEGQYAQSATQIAAAETVEALEAVQF